MLRVVPVGLFMVMVLASTSLAADKPRIAVLSVTPSDPKLASLADSVAEQVMTELGELGRFETIGASDLGTLLGLDRQKKLLNCGESDCMAELSALPGS